MSKRAIRRNHKDRLYKRALKICKHNFSDRVDNIEMMAKKFINNMKCCSCYLCCNNRRNKWLSNKERISIQERKINDKY